MRAVVIGLCLVLLFTCLPQGFRVKNGPTSNLVHAQGLAESGISLLASILKGLYSILGYFNTAFAMVVNLFTSCYTSLAITAPEFTAGAMAGFLFPVLGGYMLCAMMHPIGWISLLITFVVGFPIPLPLELLCAGIGIIPGIFMGLLLGTLSLLSRPTPGEVILSSVEQ